MNRSTVFLAALAVSIPAAGQAKTAAEHAPAMTAQPSPTATEAGDVRGQVTLAFTVDAHGAPHNIAVVESEPPGLFDRNAISTVHRAHFKLQYSRGKPVAYQAKTTYKYVLHAPPAVRTDKPDSAVTVLAFVKPKYPLAARKQCLTGSVDLQFVVNARGRATNIKVVGGKNIKSFATNARAALEQSYFMPKYVNGRAIASPADFTYDFPEAPDGNDSFGSIGTLPLPKAPLNPCYPTEAVRRGIEGFITFEFSIDASGHTSNVAVVGSRPQGVFDACALEALLNSRFYPRCEDGHPVASEHNSYTYRFTLNN